MSRFCLVLKSMMAQYKQYQDSRKVLKEKEISQRRFLKMIIESLKKENKKY